MSGLRSALSVALTVTLAACGQSTSPDSGPSDGAPSDAGGDAREVGSDAPSDAGDVATDRSSDTNVADNGSDATDATLPDVQDTSIVDTFDSTLPDTTMGDGTVPDSAPVDTSTGSDSSDTPVPRDAGPPLAWNSPCTGTDACAAPAGQSGLCATSFGHPVCVSTCSGLADFSLCEGGAGMCVPLGMGVSVCVPKCGDTEAATCGAGSSCLAVGYRDHTATDGGYTPVGACIPDCATSGADGCMEPGFSCDVNSRSCSGPCTSGCEAGSHCAGPGCFPNTPIAEYGTCTPTTDGSANGCVADLCFAAPAMPGFCGAPCNTENGTTACGSGGVCWTDYLYSSVTADGGTIPFPLENFTVLGGRTTGVCMRNCADSSDCPAGFACGEFYGGRACLPSTLARGMSSPGSALAGQVCRLNSDCASGSCARPPGYADGLCLRASPILPCPAGTTAGTDGLSCAPNCDATTYDPCPASLTCDATHGICVIGICRDNADCADGRICDHAQSLCVATAATGTAIGTACTTDTSCSGQICITTTPADAGTTTWPGGYCTSLCTPLPDLSDTCPAGSVCIAGNAGVVGECVRLCDAGAGVTRFGACRAGYVCTATPGDPRYGVCFP